MEVSVIVPTYNPDKYLDDCIESLIRQTLDHSLFEVIIVLNGDKYPYFSKISDLIKNHANFQIVYTPEKGVSNARNAGIDKAKGDYICFIDDDDIVSNNYLEALFSNVKGKDNCIAVSNVYTFEKDLSDLGQDYLTRSFLKQSKETLFNRRSFLSTSCCKIIPKKTIDKNYFNENFAKDEDSLFMFSISNNIDKIIKVEDNAIYYRRIRANSASRKRQKKLDRINHGCALIKEYTTIFRTKNKNYDTKLYLSRIIATIINL